MNALQRFAKLRALYVQRGKLALKAMGEDCFVPSALANLLDVERQIKDLEAQDNSGGVDWRPNEVIPEDYDAG